MLQENENSTVNFYHQLDAHIFSVRFTKLLLQTYQYSPIIQPTPFENIDLCLNRACTALATLILKELLQWFMSNKEKHTKVVDIHNIKGKPRAARFAVSTDIRCKSP